MEVLAIGPNERAAVAKVVAHAQKRENWYSPHHSMELDKIPGNNKAHICLMGTFRCVFSWTIDYEGQRVMRHLSVSTRTPHTLPSPEATRVIALLFGFTIPEAEQDQDWPESWMVAVKNKPQIIDDPCIVLGQDTGLAVDFPGV